MHTARVLSQLAASFSSLDLLCATLDTAEGLAQHLVSGSLEHVGDAVWMDLHTSLNQFWLLARCIKVMAVDSRPIPHASVAFAAMSVLPQLHGPGIRTDAEPLEEQGSNLVVFRCAEASRQVSNTYYISIMQHAGPLPCTCVALSRVFVLCREAALGLSQLLSAHV